MKLSTRLQLGLALVSMLVLLAFFIYVIAKVGSGNDLGKAFDPSGSTTGNLSGVLFGVLYGLLIFVGFETAANLAEETKQPKRADPEGRPRRRGHRLDLLSDRLLHAGRRVPFRAWNVLDSRRLRRTAVRARWPIQLHGTVRLLELIVVCLDMLAVYVGAAVASTRGVFAMSRDRRLPAMMAKVSPASARLWARSCC